MKVYLKSVCLVVSCIYFVIILIKYKFKYILYLCHVIKNDVHPIAFFTKSQTRENFENYKIDDLQDFTTFIGKY
jgi:hypothetical protein